MVSIGRQPRTLNVDGGLSTSHPRIVIAIVLLKHVKTAGNGRIAVLAKSSEEGAVYAEDKRLVSSIRSITGLPLEQKREQ